VNCDYAVSGVADMLTSWMPLADVPVSLGGLAVLPGRHLNRPRRPWPLAGTEHGWTTTSHRAGDVIIFHCLTPHAALPNTACQLRLSAHFRWQDPGSPAPAEPIPGRSLSGQQGQPDRRRAPVGAVADQPASGLRDPLLVRAQRGSGDMLAVMDRDTDVMEGTGKLRDSRQRRDC
jgi:ectoine hydroxylase-related dioxygenase (phytanoyl-CoA dioxygenase family)